MSKKTIYLEDAIGAVGSMLRRKFGVGGDLAEITLSGLPSAQPEKRTEKRTETHACDLISRQAAIDAAVKGADPYYKDSIVEELMNLPPAQLELIMCKDCKFADREATSSNGMYWCILYGSYMRYCSDATRRTDADMRGEK